MPAQIQNIVTSGTFSLDGGTWDVDNNVWIIGDDSEVFVIDPAHEPAKIREAVGDRTVKAVLLTHGHDDHIRYAREFADLVDAPVHLNPADAMLWEAIFPGTAADHEISDGDTFEVAGTTLVALHTPGHSPGSTCFYVESLEPCSPATHCSTADREPPGAATRASRRSSTRSASAC